MNLTVIEIARQVRQKRITAHDIMKRALARIQKHNLKLNCFVYLDGENALRRADHIDQLVAAGEDPGLLAGVPFGVKDLNHCAGMPTTFGSLIFKNVEPRKISNIFVRRLQDAGAVAVGKTTAAEFGMDSATCPPLSGITRNPWHLERTSGGSSGGSAAAVAAGMLPFCTGGDTAGSIRAPASFTGTVGLKPTLGLVPNEPGFDPFHCNGVFTTTVADTARLLDVMTGETVQDRSSLPISGQCFEQTINKISTQGLKVLWSPDHGSVRGSEGTLAVAHQAASVLMKTAGLVPVSCTFNPPNVQSQWHKIALWDIRNQIKAVGDIEVLIQHLGNPMKAMLGKYDPNGEELYKAYQQIATLFSFVDELFQQVDILLSPATAATAHWADGKLLQHADGTDISAEPFGFLANACGLPSISVPAGIAVDGMPVGLQITARKGQDQLVLRLAQCLEGQQPWPRMAPYPWEAGDSAI